MIHDSCWCSRSAVTALDPIETLYQVYHGFLTEINLSWTSKKHHLQDVWPDSPDCEIDIKIEDGGLDLFQFDPGAFKLTSREGLSTGSYPFSVVAYQKEYPDEADLYQVLESTFEVFIAEECKDTKIIP